MDEEISEEALYDEIARAVVKVLKEHGAVRLADNVNPDGVNLPELLMELDDLGFSISAPTYYNKIRPKCIEMGYSVVANGKGQYIGSPGEWTRNVKNARDQMIGRTYNQRRVLTAASEAMSLAEGNEYSKKTFGMDLGTASKLFKVVGDVINSDILPWPKELHIYLLENGEGPTP